MGFYFKLAPGVRIRASSRGLRASVGPRAARVHVGAGRAGISTGAGPVTLYHSVGGGRRRRSSGPSRTSIAAYERQMRQAQKLEQARELMAAFEHILNMHREDFTPVSPPIAPPPEPVDVGALRQRREREALQGIGVFQRSARAAARRQAEAAVSREVQYETSRREQEQAEVQRQLDAEWQRLLANDPDVVAGALTDAFEDNETFAAPVGVHGDEVALVVLAPPLDVVPERMPRTTAAGNLSLARLNKTERNSYYAQLVCGHVLTTVREVLAVAPAIAWVRTAVIRLTPPSAYGARNVECILAALFTREAFHGVQWDFVSATTIVNDASAELSIRQGATGELRPLDLAREPALAALVRAVEVGDVTEAEGGKISPQVTALPAATPPPWRPRPGWGTIRDYRTVTNDHGGTDARCKFVPDDGGVPAELDLPGLTMPELGEYARGVMLSPGQLTIKVSAATMADVERSVFGRINEMEPTKRALMYAEGNDLNEDCGWAWTADCKLVKAAPGLIH